MHHKQLEWQIRTCKMNAVYKGVGISWPRTSLPARMSMADPLQYQDLPKKRIMREGLY